MDKTIEYESEKEQTERTSYSEMKEKEQMWPLDKLIKEFRALFTDKASFMNLYSSTHILTSKMLAQPQDNPELSFKPTLNKKSKMLDVSRLKSNLLSELLRHNTMEKHTSLESLRIMQIRLKLLSSLRLGLRSFIIITSIFRRSKHLRSYQKTVA